MVKSIQSFGAVFIACVLFWDSATAAEPLSREEQLALTSRSYPRDPETVFVAAEKLFRLADKPKDLTITYPDERSMLVIRRYTAVILSVQYRWAISVMPESTGSRIRVSLSTGASGPLSRPGAGTTTVSPDVIQLFYSRMDALLGQGGQWQTCDDYKRMHPKHTIIDALCAGAEDQRPDLSGP
jgi:hypothetical protein